MFRTASSAVGEAVVVVSAAAVGNAVGVGVVVVLVVVDIFFCTLVFSRCFGYSSSTGKCVSVGVALHCLYVSVVLICQGVSGGNVHY